ncbi:molybdate ABC transporter substrate-binding protein [Amorphus coralli]|uniref:molybdate ABC transporter substrate-binding protein n=1 Tax=Amorphus coralli TaxID=340680 RepID=UPI00037F60C2|nr:molybdate ABC transporter substrate-binding protein [Amorphus coralli]
MAAGRTGIALAAAVLVAGILQADPAVAGQARVAVASNFTDAARRIAAAFEAQGDHTVTLSFGSTGQIFTQIAQGAPFDAFLAADQTRPERAVAEGLAVAGSRFTYASGRLALYSADPGLVTGETTLARGTFDKLAIANPETAPYGAAAIETMEALGVLDAIRPKLVRGANIAQTYQFVATGNAELGFVALSQIAASEGGSRWIVPETLHAPIAQDAVLLSEAADRQAAIAFLAFLKGPDARAIIAGFGYGVPAP